MANTYFLVDHRVGPNEKIDRFRPEPPSHLDEGNVAGGDTRSRR